MNVAYLSLGGIILDDIPQVAGRAAVSAATTIEQVGPPAPLAEAGQRLAAYLPQIKVNEA